MDKQRYCGECGQPVGENDVFCQNCGRELPSRDAAPEEPTPVRIPEAEENPDDFMQQQQAKKLMRELAAEKAREQRSVWQRIIDWFRRV